MTAERILRINLARDHGLIRPSMSCGVELEQLGGYIFGLEPGERGAECSNGGVEPYE